MTENNSSFAEILQQALRAGEACTRKTMTCDDLLISIAGDAPLRFPLTKTKVRSLIKLSQPARFGLKDKTLEDKNVRDTWEIPRNRIKIDKRQWNKTLKPLLADIAADLGLAEGSTFDAQLHNLLIYEPGQFFLSHQDSEKLDGMVATLVVVLPSKHKGGSLVIEHGGEKRTMQTSRARLDALSCIAFYADCHHEVKPITEGYRVALTYNLVLKSGRAAIPSDENEKPLVSALTDYFDSADEANYAMVEEANNHWQRPSPPKWVYLLDHQYTQKSLTPSQLKNQDRTGFELISKAAQAMACDVTLGLIELKEMWDAYSEEDTYDRYGNCWDDEYDEDDDEYEEEHQSDAYVLNSLIDKEIALTYTASEETGASLSSEVVLDESQIFWTKPCEDFDPFDSEYEGWMGNYGNTLERWYHRACIILTRKSDHYAVMCETKPGRLVEALTKLTKNDTSLVEAQQVVKQILPYWPAANNYEALNSSKWINDVFRLSARIKDEMLARKLTEPLTLNALKDKTAKTFANLINGYDDTFAVSLLVGLQKKNDKYLLSFEPLIDALTKHLKSNASIQWLLNYQFDKITDECNQQGRRTPVSIKDAEPMRMALMTEFLNTCMMVDNQERYQKGVIYIEQQQRLFPVLAKAELLLSLKKLPKIKTYTGYLMLYQSVNLSLAQMVAQPHRRSDDWSIEDEVNCSCALCNTLSEFLIARDEQRKVWPIAAPKRQHIHRMIDDMGLPVTHVTKREGSPHKLVLTKTQALHDNAKKQQMAAESAFEKVGALNP